MKKQNKKIVTNLSYTSIYERLIMKSYYHTEITNIQEYIVSILSYIMFLNMTLASKV